MEDADVKFDRINESCKKECDISSDSSFRNLQKKANGLFLGLKKHDAEPENLRSALNSMVNQLHIAQNLNSARADPVDDLACDVFESLEPMMNFLIEKETLRRGDRGALVVKMEKVESITYRETYDVLNVVNMEKEDEVMDALEGTDVWSEDKRCGQSNTDKENFGTKLTLKTKPIKSAKLGKDEAKRLPHECDECGRRFSAAHYLRKHSRVHLSIGDKKLTYKCATCGKEFHTSHNLHTHMIIHSKDEDAKRPYKCDQCDKRYTQSNNLNIHKKSHLPDDDPRKEKIACEECGKMITQDRMSAHLKTHMTDDHPTRKHMCEICGNVYKWGRTLKDHMRSHQENEELRKPYKCDDCDQRFGFPGNLNEHRRVHHMSKDDPRKDMLACDECGQICNGKDVLRNHMKVHLDENDEEQAAMKRPHKCKKCGKGFRFVHNLHLHTGDFPLKCEICGMGFREQRALGKHVECHKNGTTNKTRKMAYRIVKFCTLCPRKFKNNCELEMHLKRHKDGTVDDASEDENMHNVECHKCNLCPKKYSSRTGLYIHVKMHHQGATLAKTRKIDTKVESESDEQAEPWSYDMGSEDEENENC